MVSLAPQPALLLAQRILEKVAKILIALLAVSAHSPEIKDGLQESREILVNICLAKALPRRLYGLSATHPATVAGDRNFEAVVRQGSQQWNALIPNVSSRRFRYPHVGTLFCARNAQVRARVRCRCPLTTMRSSKRFLTAGVLRLPSIDSSARSQGIFLASFVQAPSGQ